MILVTLKTKTQHKMARANILLEAALQTQEAAPTVLEPRSALRHGLPSDPPRPAAALRPFCPPARLRCRERRGGETGSPEQPRRPQTPPQALARGRRGDLMVSCQELCEAEGQGHPDEEEVG